MFESTIGLVDIGDTRQDSSSGAILLLNFVDVVCRHRLALTLRECRYKVFAPEDNGRSLSEIRDEECEAADFVIFDLSNINHDIWLQLRRICRLRKRDGRPVLVVCWSRVYRGSEFQLLVEGLGARLLYAK